MKQIIQDLKSGNTLLETVAVPAVRPGYVLIQTSRTLVSLGTERMLVEFGKANLIDKARQQPDKVKQVLNKIKTDGLKPTINAVFNKLDQPLPLGYCNVGKVVEVGKGVSEFVIGDRVASNGSHAEFVCIPKNLIAKIPDNVSDDEATFTVIGSIGLQGIRLLKPQFGETIVVIGLGLIGLIAAQLLKANGCKVIGIDFDEQKVELATSMGITGINPKHGLDPVEYVLNQTEMNGADGVLITASSKGDDVIHEACAMSRKRGKIVLVGVVGLNIRRDDFYKKELSFQVSCSYGPGRYDDVYEHKGYDYPIAFVRWTEKRNFEAILQAISSHSIDVKSLITEEVNLSDFNMIYGDMHKQGSIASIIKYSDSDVNETVITVNTPSFNRSNGQIGIIGAGNFTVSTMLPILIKIGAPICCVASAGGLSAKILAKKAGATLATSDYKKVLEDNTIDLVIIATRHDMHATMVVEALQAHKNVFVEKPLCLNIEELQQIIEVYKSNLDKSSLTVGFNRRFSPFAVKMKQLLGGAPMQIVATMNAGFIPSGSWVQELSIGGGRIIGEACHFIDLCSYLADSKVVSVCMNALGKNPEDNTDNASIFLKFANGSCAVINYFANGSKSYEKERVEVFSQERVLILNNWRKLEGFGFKNFTKMKGKMDKGHYNQFALLCERAKNGGEALIPFDSIINTTISSFACITSMKENRWVNIE